MSNREICFCNLMGGLDQQSGQNTPVQCQHQRRDQNGGNHSQSQEPPYDIGTDTSLNDHGVSCQVYGTDFCKLPESHQNQVHDERNQQGVDTPGSSGSRSQDRIHFLIGIGHGRICIQARTLNAYGVRQSSQKITKIGDQRAGADAHGQETDRSLGRAHNGLGNLRLHRYVTDQNDNSHQKERLAKDLSQYQIQYIV